MDFIYSSLYEAVVLIVNPTDELLGILFLTMVVSLISLLLATLIGLPMGATVVLRKFPLRNLIAEGFNVLAALPPVIVGLFIFMIIAKSGPLGFMEIIYTPVAMIVVQFILAFPIVAGQTRVSLARVDPSVYVGARTLGALPRQIRKIVVNEARYGILIAVVSAFSRIMSDVGAILIVGGNVVGLSRVMTTAIAVETGKGDVGLVLALGIILLFISIALSMLLYFLKKRLKYAT
jgi:tungstate transport system permease protein